MKREELRAVISAVQRLSVSVQRLEKLLEEPGESVVEGFHGWELVEKDYTSGEGLDQLYLKASLRGSWELEGPPSTPHYLVEKAIAVLGWSEEEASRRVDRAFQGGFWAGISLNCHTSYFALPALDLPTAHWVVLKTPEVFGARRVVRRSDLDKLLGDQPLRCIYEGFPTLLELDVFCAGAGRNVPDLVQWRDQE